MHFFNAQDLAILVVFARKGQVSDKVFWPILLGLKRYIATTMIIMGNLIAYQVHIGDKNSVQLLLLKLIGQQRYFLHSINIYANGARQQYRFMQMGRDNSTYRFRKIAETLACSLCRQNQVGPIVFVVPINRPVKNKLFILF